MFYDVMLEGKRLVIHNKMSVFLQVGRMKKNLEQTQVYLEERGDDSSHGQFVVEKIDDEEEVCYKQD